MAYMVIKKLHLHHKTTIGFYSYFELFVVCNPLCFPLNKFKVFYLIQSKGNSTCEIMLFLFILSQFSINL